MVKSDDWLPKGDIILENAALEAVKNVNNCLVIAGPGAGKTELLAQKLDYLFSTNECIFPKKILALSFKTDAAANMKNRVKKRYGDEYASRFTSLTYSAFEKMILDQYINALPEEIRPDRDYLVDDWDVIKATLIKNGINVNGRRMSDIRKSVENNVLNDEANLKFKKDLLKGTRNNKAVLLYKQITKLATYIIYTNKYIRKALQMTYEFVFLDEFQDTTYDQYNLLKTCFLGSTCKLTAVGDNKQAIMRWAGANPDIFQDYKLDFKANEYQLLMNHRSVPKLIEFQKEVHQILNSNHSSIQSNYYPEFQEGEITLFEFENESLESKLIANDIESKIQGGIRPSEICILAKQKVDDYSSKLIITLSSKGIKARIENEYQELLKDPTCNLLLDLISCSQGKRDPLIWENISNFYGNINGIDELTDELILAKSYKEIDNIVSDITYLISNVIPNEESMLKLIDCIIEKIDEKRIISNFSTYNRKSDLDIIVKNFSKLLYKEYSQTQGEWLDTVSSFKGENSIPIMTIHKSKGLEYEVVYFLGLEDSAFWSFNDQPEEDKSAFFVALSRAKSHLIFTYCKLRNNSPQNNRNINEIYSLLTQSNLVDVIN
ncbi:DNA helicase II [Streptococcus sp. BCA20]|jgi:ATP-dependent DNA helicase|uniref:DNA 3'-5' helicase n=3 Tax=Streptococcus TaxID=1301 RepID=S9SEP4_STROR|nr:ATP-dependent helicase [Streptococcus oralis]RSJ35456.1 DNA helicase II [Streptococcus sp. BCA20]EMG34896.1 ATP-dependent DNA helicase [Streptococcus oralis subsp. tigurinus 1366]EPX88570.1 DNA helicase [Streptococcus oralis subsp. tigurinus 2426]EPX89348.1 DNA helicase [Streptococcus oralis subsp. tigurinus 2425]RSH95881.1 DNA helicase II [Streptococcus oralis]